jgi:hypothetical protein
MPPRCARFASAALAALCLGVVSRANSAEVRAAEPPEARQFDFWLGEWEVASPDGKFQGTSKIELVANGRGLLENWTGNPAAGNSTGKSLNAWNTQKKQWQQFWIGSGGLLLELAGGLDANGSMVLTGARTSSGGSVRERITWTPNADGTVRQLWEQSKDGGKTWAVEFDGRYTRKGGKVARSGTTPYRALYYLLQ